jgi:hypothetical protein
MTINVRARSRKVLRRVVLSAALLLVAAPVALADPPGYCFQDFNQPFPATASNSTARTATNAQIVDRKADQALRTARLALREAQQKTQAAP